MRPHAQGWLSAGPDPPAWSHACDPLSQPTSRALGGPPAVSLSFRLLLPSDPQGDESVGDGGGLGEEVREGISLEEVVPAGAFLPLWGQWGWAGRGRL